MKTKTKKVATKTTLYTCTKAERDTLDYLLSLDKHLRDLDKMPKADRLRMIRMFRVMTLALES